MLGHRILTLAALTWVAALWYCKMKFYRDPGSAFFDERREFAREYSAYRETQSLGFLERASEQGTKAAESPALCAVFMSVKRIGKQPVDLAVASALEGLSPEERADFHVGVLVAHTNPEDHPSWHDPQLRNLVDEVLSYNTTQESYKMLHDWETTRDFEQKGVFDYFYGLEHCLNATRAPYIAMFEDDVIFADGWLSYTLNSLAELEMKPASHVQDWLFLRLFNQERSTGWASRKIGGNNEFIIAIAVVIPMGTIAFISRRRYPILHRYMDNWTLAIMSLVIIPAFIVLFYQAGKASLLPPRPGVRAEPFGCCAQGLVFPRSTARFVVDQLKDCGSGQVDLILNEVARREGLTRYAQYPVMMQHLGRNAVRGTVDREAQAIWSMAFEQLDSHKLAKQHLDMVRHRYETEQADK